MINLNNNKRMKIASSSTEEKKKVAVKQIAPQKQNCPKDLWEEIKQIYNLFHEVDSLISPKNNPKILSKKF